MEEDGRRWKKMEEYGRRLKKMEEDDGKNQKHEKQKFSKLLGMAWGP